MSTHIKINVCCIRKIVAALLSCALCNPAARTSALSVQNISNFPQGDNLTFQDIHKKKLDTYQLYYYIYKYIYT